MDLKRPILYANVTIELNIRGKKWGKPQVVKEQVVAGSLEQVKADEAIKRRLITDLMTPATAKTFDLNKIRILSVEKIHELGLGYMANKK